MQEKARTECPKCSRPLQNFNGHIGYCPQHKWVSPIGLGFEAEASEQNRKDAETAEQSRLKQLRQQEEAKTQELREQHQSAIRKMIAVIIALAVIAAAVVFFIVRPSVNYGAATNKLAAGDYQAARDGYADLGNYKDSAARVLLCDAMLDLQEGRAEAAADKLDQLTDEGQGEIAKQLADTLLPVVANWKDKGLSPQTLLILLGRAAIIDPNGTLDIAKLTEEGHTALLDGTQLSSYTNDVNGDGSPELVALNPDYSVTVYRMTVDGNTRITVDNEIASACEMVFGNQYKETNVNDSVACFSEAYRLSPTAETRSVLTAAYQRRATANENAGDMEAAISDAQSALDISGTDEAFSFFYGLNLRNCENGHDTATAIVLWDEFATSSSATIARFSAKARWQADAAQLHIAHAAELAAKRDEGCIAELRTAAEMGADVTGAIAEAESYFEPGLSLVRLRLLEIDLLGSDAAAEQSIRSNMAVEVRTAISEWQTLGLSPADLPVLIRLANDQGISLEGIDHEAIYEEATVAAAGNVSQYSFADWDADGYKELLTIDATGILSLHGLTETWDVLSTVDTKLPCASYAITDAEAPLILALSPDQDELLALTSDGVKLSVLFREQGISRYHADGTAITFSRLLEGSIARYSDYAYEAVGTANRPVRVGVDWQQNDYPQPMSAADAVQRYFEARAYEIPEEAALLTETADAGIFTLDSLSQLPAPDLPGRVAANAYQTTDKQTLFEIAYLSGPQSVRAWIAAEYIDGWKIVGAAETYGPDQTTNHIDFSIPLLCLNAETADTLSRGERNTYRVLAASPGRLNLLWQSGSKAVSSTAYTVTMYRTSLTGDVVFSYDLQPSPNKQQSKDQFISAGVYYVTVEGKTTDADSYHLTLHLDAEEHVELENNDTYQSATRVALNTEYSGSLSSSRDVDFFSFTLEETSAANITLKLPGKGDKTTTHILTVFSARDGGKLCTVSVPGNTQLAETGNLYLSSGIYWVQVAKGAASSNEAYILTVNVDHNGFMEAEPNDTPETSTVIPLNEVIRASIGQEGDIDCYTFTLEEDAVIQPRFTFAPTDSTSKTYLLIVTDSSRRELLKASIGGKESTKVIAPVALSAGTYTVRIENSRFIRQDYTLRLISMAVEAAETEPNDTQALATELFVGQPRTGVLTSDADVDYYKVTFAQQTEITLRFTFAQGTSRNTAFVLTIEQNGTTQLSTNVKSDSSGVEQQLKFPAGEYYIRVKPSTWMGAVYNIELQ